jgi:hypothetical protein
MKLSQKQREIKKKNMNEQNPSANRAIRDMCEEYFDLHRWELVEGASNTTLFEFSKISPTERQTLFRCCDKIEERICMLQLVLLTLKQEHLYFEDSGIPRPPNPNY